MITKALFIRFLGNQKKEAKFEKKPFSYFSSLYFNLILLMFIIIVTKLICSIKKDNKRRINVQEIIASDAEINFEPNSIKIMQN